MPRSTPPFAAAVAGFVACAAGGSGPDPVPPAAPAVPAAAAAVPLPDLADEPAVLAVLKDAWPPAADGSRAQLDLFLARDDDPAAAARSAVALHSAGVTFGFGRADRPAGERAAVRYAGVAAAAAVDADRPPDLRDDEAAVFAKLLPEIFYRYAAALADDGDLAGAEVALTRAAAAGFDFAAYWDGAVATFPALAANGVLDARRVGWEATAAVVALPPDPPPPPTPAELAADALAADPYPLAFRFTDTDGTPRTLAEYRGEVVVVDFWATWCGVCVEELPDLAALRRRRGGDGVRVIGLAYERGGDGAEARAKIAACAAEHGVNYPVGPGPADARAAIGLEAYPTKVFVDRRGRVRATLRGRGAPAAWEAILAPLLAEPPPATAGERVSE